MKERIVVGLAEVSNVYGGPEEGGWYFDAGHPVEGFTKAFFREASADAYAEHLKSLINKGERFRGVGVGGCGDDEGMCRGEGTHGGLDVVRQFTSRKSHKGLEAWPKEYPQYN